MCKHIRNAACQIRAPCCKKFFDCPACHEEKSDHDLLKADEMIIGCKKCRKVFRRPPIDQWEDADEYCPRCDAHLLVEPIMPKMPRGVMVEMEGDAEVMDQRSKRAQEFGGIKM